MAEVAVAGCVGAVGGAAGAGVAQTVSAIGGSAAERVEWALAGFASDAKRVSPLQQRGWTTEQISEAIQHGKAFAAVNLVNKGHQATRYVHPETGQSVVLDNVTREVIHVGGLGFKYF